MKTVYVKLKNIYSFPENFILHNNDITLDNMLNYNHQKGDSSIQAYTDAEYIYQVTKNVVDNKGQHIQHYLIGSDKCVENYNILVDELKFIGYKNIGSCKTKENILPYICTDIKDKIFDNYVLSIGLLENIEYTRYEIIV